MAQDISTSITRRSMVAGLALTASPIALAGADNAYAQGNETTPEGTFSRQVACFNPERSSGCPAQDG
jgi:hemoglobin